MHARITQAERGRPICDWPEVAPARVDESSGGVTVHMETPGLEAGDLHVSIRHGHLVIQSEELIQSDECGVWTRIDLALAPAVTAEGATASLSNGWLCVRIPKTGSAHSIGGPIAVQEA